MTTYSLRAAAVKMNFIQNYLAPKYCGFYKKLCAKTLNGKKMDPEISWVPNNFGPK